MSEKKGKNIKCTICDNVFYRTPARMQEFNFCSRSCANIHKHNMGVFKYRTSIKKTILTIDWNNLQREYDNGLGFRQIFKKYKITCHVINFAVKKGLFIRYKRKRIVSEETKRKISKGRKEFYRNNPDKHNWKNCEKFKSIPCERVKVFLRQEGINFIEEHTPLLDRYYSMDICFPEKMLGIEINGNQHYEETGKLKPYYQERHDLIESAGWTVLEIHYLKCFNDDFLMDLKRLLVDKQNVNLFDYQTYVPKEKGEKIERKKRIKKLKVEKSKRIKKEPKIKRDRQTYVNDVRTSWNNEQQKYVDIVLNSGIDFSKFGWVTKVAPLINQKPQKVHKWMKRIMPNIYERECFKRNK